MHIETIEQGHTDQRMNTGHRNPTFTNEWHRITLITNYNII